MTNGEALKAKENKGNKRHPCDLCKAMVKNINCDGCFFKELDTEGSECHVENCFLNQDGMCKISLYDGCGMCVSQWYGDCVEGR